MLLRKDDEMRQGEVVMRRDDDAETGRHGDTVWNGEVLRRAGKVLLGVVLARFSVVWWRLCEAVFRGGKVSFRADR